MSYARFGSDSSVYVFLAVNGHLECCACRFDEGWSFPNTDAMLAHLEQHKEAGHLVPDYCIEGLIEHRAENDAWIAAASRERQADD